MSNSSVINTARWDSEVRQWTMTGGPSFATMVVTIQSGNEQRAATWIDPLSKWNLGDRNVPEKDYQVLLNFFYRMKGRLYGFRVRDWLDFRDNGNGVLGQGNGDPSTTSFQMYKYRQAPNTTGIYQQKITRPVGFSFAALNLENTVTVFVNGVAQVMDPTGTIPGSWNVDDSQGICTMRPFQFNFTQIDADGTIHLSQPHNFAVGEWCYLYGPIVQPQYFQITAVPDNTTIVVTGLGGITWTGAGIVESRLSPTDQIAWTGEYDYPARFDTDSFNMNQALQYIENEQQIAPTTVWYTLGSIPVIQLRE